MWLGGNQSNQQHQRPSQRQTARRPQHRVTPQMHIQIETVRAMFPDIPIAAIQADLQRTGSVETTVDNALRDGGLPLPPSASPSTNTAASNNSNNASSSSARKTPSHVNLVQRYKIDVDHSENTEEPPKTWESNPDKRQEMLRKRKEFMVLQARKKMMEQTKKKEGQSNSTEKNEIAEQSTSTKSFDDMSVDELNSLTAEQRREQMLKALDQRNN
ncbi:hypothetical protein G6F46_002337 [Rhizopus delemar]|uniref:CUE domain-containing protein n=2 Tax=Rhizopus TaxID=4842 RepID=A0A9P6Z8D4_9FUNG|nr:hypothetical protein G6F55_002358 [Rhizopus delemar]KAG1548418.1 hypothetical protein G6F51_003675 [Rhizopus arrhizus]KAG1501559.1 hypothetical protein G6F54_002961 [Rhizopus delemar]KAG1515126.1 hypothetical protein G6F53_003155 [Rhizopus delemar]KAG1525909.1 hypothetical protein G6F52_002910 [Rhizopus delemar]